MRHIDTHPRRLPILCFGRSAAGPLTSMFARHNASSAAKGGLEEQPRSARHTERRSAILSQ